VKPTTTRSQVGVGDAEEALEAVERECPSLVGGRELTQWLAEHVTEPIVHRRVMPRAALWLEQIALDNIVRRNELEKRRALVVPGELNITEQVRNRVWPACDRSPFESMVFARAKGVQCLRNRFDD
jgi:hypothetical protein